MSHRSTTLNLVSRRCPGALTHYENRVPYDRDLFQVGIAAHALLQAAAENRGVDLSVLAEKVAHDLVTNGRSFDGEPEPPMRPADALSGVTLARRYLENHPLSETSSAEIGMGVARDLVTPAPYAESYLRAILDVVDVIDEEQEDGYAPMRVLVVQDWKSAWPTDASELDGIQLKIQGVIGLAHHPDVSMIRRVVTNLRTGQSYSDDTLLDDEGTATVEGWRNEIRLAIAQAEMSPRPFSPGAGCSGCFYLTRCEAARAYLRGSMLDGTPEQLATRYAVASAVKDALVSTLKEMATEREIAYPAAKVKGVEVGGGYVGYATKTKTEATPEAAAALTEAWGGEWTDKTRELVATMKPGSRQVDAVAKRVYPSRKGTEWKAQRAALEAAALVKVTTSEFGIHRDPVVVADNMPFDVVSSDNLNDDE